MKSFAVLAVLYFCAVNALPYEQQEYLDDEGQEEYYLVPVHRVRRQLDISKSGQGTRVTVGHGGTLVDNNRHRLDGSAFASKTFRPSGPTTVGGNLDYQHKPSGSTAGLGVQHTPRYGTDVNANGNLNLYRGNGGRTTLDANGYYGRHFGGPSGSSRPNYGGGLNFNHKF